MVVVKKYFMKILIILFFSNSVFSQNDTDLLPVRYKITNEILKKEIDYFSKKYGEEYKNEEKVIIILISQKNNQKKYKITYSFGLHFLEFGFEEKFKGYPDIVTRHQDNYIFIYMMDFFNDLKPQNKFLIILAKNCFPNQYQDFLKKSPNEFFIRNHHQVPTLELKFKDGKLVEKEEFRE